LESGPFVAVQGCPKTSKTTFYRRRPNDRIVGPRSKTRIGYQDIAANNCTMAKAKRSRAINMLFIGNSFTQRNNLPALLAELAAARSLLVKHELISVGGASLRTHWNAGRATKAIATGGFDYVVLQEQSTLPVKNAQRMAENVRLFDDTIKRAGSKTVLYMTWARQNAPETQQAIADAYNSIGKELEAIVVPVGLAWRDYLSRHDKPVLYDRDQSHPTLAGSYLAACVFLAALLKANSLGVDSGPAGLDQQDRTALQRAAWQQCRLSAANEKEKYP
jgi:hypothetical protein